MPPLHVTTEFCLLTLVSHTLGSLSALLLTLPKAAKTHCPHEEKAGIQHIPSYSDKRDTFPQRLTVPLWSAVCKRYMPLHIIFKCFLPPALKQFCFSCMKYFFMQVWPYQESSRSSVEISFPSLTHESINKNA